MPALVTGATGFLGRHLCRELEEAGHNLVRVSSTNCDLRSETSLRQFDSQSFDYIFHLATWTQAGDFCLRHPGEQWLVNQQINTNLLAWWQQFQPQAKLVAMGSSCCYDPALPLEEKAFLKGEPIESLYAYAMTKRMLYVGMEALRKQYGLRYLFLVPSTLYGEGYRSDGRQSHFIFDLLRKILEYREDRTRVPVLWGNGRQSREIVYVEDVVQVALGLAPLVDNEIVNVGSGEEHSIRWFAEQIARHAGVEPEDIQYDTGKYVGAKSKLLSIDKLLGLLPDYRPTSAEAGLKQLVESALPPLGLLAADHESNCTPQGAANGSTRSSSGECAQEHRTCHPGDTVEIEDA
ncbi:MAG: NAD-dependent epimerase/dehydratase family protein [Candidatus Eremiobacteraeota bacterium]|nr:NAD-dependent epimerase/dehydratase family protein [Candidatus Eremiobacteraeota bacterium]